MVGSFGDLRRFGLKNNLTEINHKVSVLAKRFQRVFTAVFAAKWQRVVQTPD